MLWGARLNRFQRVGDQGMSANEAGILLVAALVLLAITFAWRQSRDRSLRPFPLAEFDAAYLRGQDRRRFLGSVVMIVIAGAMAYGMTIDFRGNRLQAKLFIGIWLAIILLVFLLLALAFADWRATRDYARHHLRRLREEREAFLASQPTPPATPHANGKPRPS